MSDTRSTGPISGREAAFQAVAGVLTRQRFVTETLAALRDQGRMSQREAGLANEIALGTVRHLLTIESVLPSIAQYDPRQVQPEIRTILALAAYQAIWMDRVPFFALVNEAVALAHQHARKASVGMVNAILRLLTGAIETRRKPWRPGSPAQVRVDWADACEFRNDVLPAADPDLEEYLAAAAGERPGRLRTLGERFGWEAAAQIAWASQAVPVVVLQRNVARLMSDRFASRVRDAFGPDAICSGDAAFLTPGTPVIESEIFQRGEVYVQDSTAQAAAALLAVMPGERVLDLCAAPGGKSVCFAARMSDDGEVVACDVEADRLVQVAANADRLGLRCIRTHLLDPYDGDMDVDGTFDAAMVDAPCSNTGVIARRPEARLGLTRQKVESLVELQARLLRRAAEHVRAGGRMVYSTCCLEPEENDQVVDSFVKEHPEWHVRERRQTLPQWGATPGDWRDGGFAAKLVRLE
ncbi:MAG: hypothetical protein JXO22_00885 [Phycisphaerae bacterium]|nr:hypothetical protein [Phycisphaerae bacterium]